MELAEIVFRDHPRYGPAYHADECDQKKWATKVKKRCEKLILEARKHIHEMERAGPGITSLDEIDFERETPFTTLARKVLAECPWYFQVKAIHDEARGGPPGGFQVGNSRTPLEETVLSQPHGSVSKSPQVREEDTDEGDDSEESKEDNTAEGGQSDHEDQADESEEDEEDNDENTRAMATLFYRYKAAEQRRRQVLEAEIDELTLEITRVKAKAEIKIVRERAKLMLYKTRVQHEAQRMRYRERITALQAGFIVPPYQPRPGGAVPPALEIPEPNAAY
ncbi:hypothetical protein BDY19DRAFT_997653 [Irpex rosettiformis]|uniref:Uncharacterized protein n=1 Tax=Irpex rosettiformis TaxID=378272 RepID=A0ACB8TR36_9APHY|nr:hypothetical protein BDY19DRAFT_997653 [Irpex rosettiformis]